MRKGADAVPVVRVWQQARAARAQRGEAWAGEQAGWAGGALRERESSQSIGPTLSSTIRLSGDFSCSRTIECTAVLYMYPSFAIIWVGGAGRAVGQQQRQGGRWHAGWQAGQWAPTHLVDDNVNEDGQL